MTTWLAKVWETPFVELFHITVAKTLNIQIMVWTLKTDDGDDRLEVLRCYDPKNEKQTVVFDSCNLVWCLTSQNRAHFQLMLKKKQKKKKQVIINVE